MIDPTGIPEIHGDMTVLTEHAGELSGVGGEFTGTGARVNSTWQGLAGVYAAPEIGTLLTATAPVASISASVGEDLVVAGRALHAYADEVAVIKAQLAVLRAQAGAFVTSVSADDDWTSDGDQVDRNRELIEAVNAQVAAFFAAQRRCANTINALYGGRQYTAEDGDRQVESGEYGYTAERLNAAAQQEGALPWGYADRKDRGLFGDLGAFVGGVWDGAVQMVTGLGALIGRDPVTGEWSWGAAGTAWQGLGTFALAAGVYVMPGGMLLDQTVGAPGLRRGQCGDTLLTAGKSLIAYDQWGKDPARASGNAAFNIVSAVVGTKGAGAAMRGAGAAAEGSRITAVSVSGTALVRSGEFIARLPSVDDITARAMQRLPGFHLPDLSATPHINVPHHVDLAPSQVDVPHRHVGVTHGGTTPDLAPGTVGHALSHTPDTPPLPDTPLHHGAEVPTQRSDTLPGSRVDVHGIPDGHPVDTTPDIPQADHASGDGTPNDGIDRGDTALVDGATLVDGSTTQHAGLDLTQHTGVDHMPALGPGDRSLEVLPESRIERGADGLVDTVDGRPVDDYLHDVAHQRAEQFREGRLAEHFSRGEVGEVSSVAVDRRTGEFFEATNGRSRDGITLDDLHPLLQERLDRLEAAGPYPATNKDGSLGPGSWPHPHPDNPLSHAEIRAVNELLWRRGGDVGPEVFGELRVDNYFPFKGDAVQSAPYCANCTALLTGTPSNAGRFAGFPPGPHNFLPE